MHNPPGCSNFPPQQQHIPMFKLDRIILQ